MSRLSPTRVVLVVTALVVVYFLLSGALQAVRSHQLGQEQGRLEAELRQLQERYRRLEALRDYLNSDEYIETVAREQLGLVRPGEQAIVVIAPAPTASAKDGPEGEASPSPELWWEELIRP